MPFVDLLETLRRDLSAEREALDSVLAPLSLDAWATPTPAEGWTIKDTVAHLHRTDQAALIAVDDPERFRRDFDAISEAVFHPTYARDVPPLLAAWRETAAEVTEKVSAVPRGEKIVWLGLPLSPMWFLTARLMETWAHTQDIADALGVSRQPTGRLRHVAHIGVGTRAFSYAIRGKTQPPGPVRVELTAPDGTVWTWGPEEAEDRVAGPALDFCLLVTQRRHRDDLALAIEGPGATEWMAIAQAFAGAPGPGRPAGPDTYARPLAR